MTRQDLLVLPAKQAFKVSEQGVDAIIGYLKGTDQLVVDVKAVNKSAGTTEYHLRPGNAAHTLFGVGGAPSDGPALTSATLWIGTRAAPVVGADGEYHFWLMLKAARYPAVAQRFLNRLHRMVHMRPWVVTIAVPEGS